MIEEIHKGDYKRFFLCVEASLPNVQTKVGASLWSAEMYLSIWETGEWRGMTHGDAGIWPSANKALSLSGSPVKTRPAIHSWFPWLSMILRAESNKSWRQTGERYPDILLAPACYIDWVVTHLTVMSCSQLSWSNLRSQLQFVSSPRTVEMKKKKINGSDLWSFRKSLSGSD